MSQRLAVMYNGRIVQCGQPREVYEEPADAFVADFLGVANLLPARFVTPGRLEVAGTTLDIDHPSAVPNGGPVRLLVRPERVRLCADGSSGPNTLPATVEHVVYAGSITQVQLRLDDGSSLQAMLANDGDSTLPVGSGRVAVQLAPAALRVIAADVRPRPDGTPVLRMSRLLSSAPPSSSPARVVPRGGRARK